MVRTRAVSTNLIKRLLTHKSLGLKPLTPKFQLINPVNVNQDDTWATNTQYLVPNFLFAHSPSTIHNAPLKVVNFRGKEKP
jgi:hypothetical protein